MILTLRVKLRIKIAILSKKSFPFVREVGYSELDMLNIFIHDSCKIIESIFFNSDITIYDVHTKGFNLPCSTRHQFYVRDLIIVFILGHRVYI
jgi:hypothetical protein